MIPLAHTWPQHRNSRYANETHLWSITDDEDTFKRHCANPNTYKKLDSLGWLTTEIIYRYNEQGFRSIDFNTNLSAGLALGCSFTQGIGLLEKQVWPSVVSKQLNYPIWNLGVGGCSMDTVFRLADYWLPILKPKFVLLACPPKSRVELHQLHNSITSFVPGNNTNEHSDFYKQWLLSPINAEINFKKNLLAIEAVCIQNDVPLVNLAIDTDFLFDRKGRDLMHSGPEAHIDFANKMIEKLNNNNIL